MSVRVGSANLSAAGKDLAVEWNRAKNQWRDIKAVEFEAKYLESLPQMIAQAAPIMEELDTIIRKVRHDCE
jgi:hypothetical protein